MNKHNIEVPLGFVRIDENFLLKNQTANGSWTSRQLKLLGIELPWKSGWKRRLYGKLITEKEAELFKEYSTQYVKKRRKSGEIEYKIVTSPRFT